MTAPDPTAGEQCRYVMHGPGDTCDCQSRLAQVATHTRTSTPVGPDYCAECSEAISEWVQWPCASASPPAVAASTGTSEDEEALAKVILAERLAARELPNTYMDDAELVESMKPRARAVLASDWLAAREAAARAEERRVAVAALIMTGRHTTETANAALDQHAARIAREGRP